MSLPFHKEHLGAALDPTKLALSREPAPPQRPARTAPHEFPPASPELLEWYANWLERHGPAIEGSGGDNHLLEACYKARDLGLSVDEALLVLVDWNETCQPPWGIDDIEDKLGRNGQKTFGSERAITEEGAKLRERERKRVSDTRLREVFATVARNDNGEPAPDSYEGKLHQARVDLDAYRGRANTTSERLAFESGATFMKRARQLAPWLVVGLIPSNGVIAIAGEPKTAKTWAGLELLQAIATGTPAFGEFQTREARPVAAFLAEDSAEATQNRLRSLAVSRGMSVEAACANVYVNCRTSIDITDEGALCALIVAIRAIPGVSVVLLDPLRDITTAEENDSGQVSETMRRLRAIRDLCGVTVVFVHHTSKSSKETSGRRKGQMMRGSSAIHGAIDGGLYLTHQEGTSTQLNAKAEVELKAAKGAAPFKLRLDITDDAHGEAKEARWGHEREDREAEAASGDATLKDAIVAMLRAMNKTNPGFYPSRKAVREQMSAGKPRVDRAVDALILEQRIRYGPGMRGLGYVMQEGEQ